LCNLLYRGDGIPGTISRVGGTCNAGGIEKVETGYRLGTEYFLQAYKLGYGGHIPILGLYKHGTEILFFGTIGRQRLYIYPILLSKTGEIRGIDTSNIALQSIKDTIDIDSVILC